MTGIVLPMSVIMPIRMELRRIIISAVEDSHIIVLKEVDGNRSFRIEIGVCEATSISRRVHGEVSSRPFTHDLVLSAIEHLGGELQDVIISDLQDGTYYAQIRLRQDGELIAIDSRPSDAIPIAITAKVPIYVNEDVLGDAVDE
jgi:uncharacterized protein